MTKHGESEDTKQLKVRVLVDEHPTRTRARAHLHWRGNELTGIGMARLNPTDRNVAEIGDELAVARALSNLADQLFPRRRPTFMRSPTSLS